MNALIEKVYAIDPITPITPPTGMTNLNGLVEIVITWITYIAGAAAFIYLVYSGILYISAAGNPDQAKKGQQGIVNAVIGIIVVVLALTIISVVKNAATGNVSNNLPCTTAATATGCPTGTSTDCKPVVTVTPSLTCR